MVQKLLFGVCFENLPENLKLIDKHAYFQEKLATNITYFTIQFWSKNVTHFTNINSLNIIKNRIPQYNQKPFSFYIFSCKPVSG